jgi:murein DD-endopeptidase MepM/ murein hydrolase activator NlpD
VARSSTIVSLARRVAIGAALIVALPLGACKPRVLAAPPAADQLAAASAVPAADRLIQALSSGGVAGLRAAMTPALRAQVSAGELVDAGMRLRTKYGRPLGVLEERSHREDDLTWYSGLVVHQRGQPGARLVLYQFALDDAGRYARLLVREHIGVADIKVPADAYLAVTRFHFPSVGEWTIVHGGRRLATNYHHKSRGQRFAYDMVVRQGGRQRRGAGNAAAFCYGKDVLAPAAGTVVTAVNDVPENRPGEEGKGGGNGVVIDHGFGEYTSLWHFIPGSVRVKVGDRVEVGQPLGRVGNSGHSSGPHIHFHASTDPRRGDSFGIPAPFVDLYVDGVWRERALPVRDQRVRRAVEGPPSRRQARAPEVLLRF